MNFTALQAHILERLRTRLPAIGSEGGVHILSAAELGAADGTHPVPAAIVLYSDYSVAESDGHAKRVRIEQTWLVVVAVRQSGQIKSGAPAVAQAGQIVSAVIDALHGAVLPGATKPLALANAPAPSFEAGYYYLPLAFVTEIIHRASAA